MLPKVALVGAGPGDPGLLTLRGRELLERAEVVIYDHLASPELLNYAPPEAERIYVGRRSSEHPGFQETINRMLVEKARAGKRVVRLKGSDPFIFGRGGEEAEALHGAGIPFEVVPGVTAGSGVPAHAGIPLFGRRIVVTRAAHQAAAFVRELRDRGAVAIELPTIELCDPDNFEPLDRALGRLDQYDWLIFTSANGVERFFQRLESLGRDARAIGGRVCAIGPATDEELRRHGVRADRTAAEFRAEGLVDALAGEEVKGRRVLIPRAAVARDLLPKELEARGARVEVVETYRTVAPKIDPARIAEVLEEADIITFTSSSTAQNCPPELRALPAASIGPITTEAATRAGFRVVVEAREYTTGGLLAALESYFAR